MKKLLSVLLVGLVLAGCGGVDLDDPETLDEIITEAIDGSALETRDSLKYAPGEQTPYTGWAKGMYDNGQVRQLGQFKDGKVYGTATTWYGNGQKWGEISTEDGKLMTFVAWKPNGEKCPETNVLNGNGVVVTYNDDGTESSRNTVKNGKIVRN